MEGLCDRQRWLFLRLTAKKMRSETSIFTKRHSLPLLMSPISDNAERFLKGTVLKEHLAETFQFSGGSACSRFPRNLSIDSLYGAIEKDNEGIAERAL